MHELDTTTLHPVFPQRLDWSSLIGLFILNFGALELALSDILKLRTKPKSRKAVAKKKFNEKIQHLKLLVDQHSSMVEKRNAWNALIGRMQTIRDLRNHICHSTLVHRVTQDMTEMRQELCATQDLGADLPDALKVSFDELLRQNQLLSDMLNGLAELAHECGGPYKPIEGTQPVDGMWTLDARRY